jgi:hypothetical protein
MSRAARHQVRPAARAWCRAADTLASPSICEMCTGSMRTVCLVAAVVAVAPAAPVALFVGTSWSPREVPARA